MSETGEREYIVFSVYSATVWETVSVRASSKREAAAKLRSGGSYVGIDTGYERVGRRRVRRVEGPNDA